jgi:serine protease Do
MSHMIQKRRRFGLQMVGLVSGVVLALSFAAKFTPAAEPAPVSSAITQSAAAPGSFADVIEHVSPAVVNISVSKLEQPTAGYQVFPGGSGGDSPLDQFFGRFFNGPGAMPQQRHRSEGLGSGFLIDPSGYVVTNNHVAGDADKIVVTLQDGTKLDAKLVGADAKTDLALLKVESSHALPYLKFADSDRARVGDWVVAIGNPFGLGGTATAGIISARGRDIQSGPYDDYLQIDAPINAGNSGGPVFNTAGEVIGVNTAIFSPNGGNIGIGFAIPADQAKTIVAELKSNGSIERGWLGVQIQDLDTDLAKSLGLKDTKGALVADVLGDGPAKAAGVKTGDVIVRFGAAEVDSAKALSRAVGDSRPGERVSVRVWRDGRTQDLSIKLGEASTDQVAAVPDRSNDAASDLGLALEPLTDEYRARFGVADDTHGALVADVDPDGAAAEKGLRPGDIITQVNHKAIGTVSDAVTAIQEAKAKGTTALLLVRRGDGQRFVSLGFA